MCPSYRTSNKPLEIWLGLFPSGPHGGHFTAGCYGVRCEDGEVRSSLFQQAELGRKRGKGAGRPGSFRLEERYLFKM